MCQTLYYGYRKPPGTPFNADTGKLTGAQAVIDTVLPMLAAGSSFSETADRLNALNVPTGE